MNILALDLGTCFGYAREAGGELSLGSEELATAKEVTEWNKTHVARRCDPRFQRFRQHVIRLALGCDLVVFEDVLFCNSRCQCHLWATWRAAIWSCVLSENLECVPTATLKSYATGHGGSDKTDMGRSMVERDPVRFHAVLKGSKWLVSDRATGAILDDNAVDAYWLLQWAKENVKR